jgi:hypothetical protein
MSNKINISCTGGILLGRPIVAFNREQILSLIVQLDKTVEAHKQFLIFLEDILSELEGQEKRYASDPFTRL